VLDEFEWPKADRLLDEALLGGLVGGIDRRQRGEEVETRIDFLGQLHFEREVVDFLQAGDFLGFSLLDRGRALDHADKTRAGIGLGAVHDAIVGPDDVVGRHPAAMVEIGVVAQLEGMNETSARDGDLPGQAPEPACPRRSPRCRATDAGLWRRSRPGRAVSYECPCW
jgi:hypothetical protein